jgi:putative N-acetylmannosamine-6-phosphate epimerase
MSLVSNGLLSAAADTQEAFAIEINISRQGRLATSIADFAMDIRDGVDAVGRMMKGYTDQRFRSDKPQIHNARDPSKSQV